MGSVVIIKCEGKVITCIGLWQWFLPKRCTNSQNYIKCMHMHRCYIAANMDLQFTFRSCFYRVVNDHAARIH